MRAVVTMFVGGLAVIGCGDPRDTVVRKESSNTPCLSAPLSCPAGETCWYANDTASQFVCLASTPRGVGETCDPLVGTATCNDGLVCVRLFESSVSRCVAYCNLDPAAGQGCPSGEECNAVTVSSGVVLPLCQPTSIVDAGPG